MHPPAGVSTQHEPRRQHTGIIKNQQISRPQQARKVPEKSMPDRLTRPLVVQEPRPCPIDGGKLRDQIGRQVKIKFIGSHRQTVPVKVR